MKVFFRDIKKLTPEVRELWILERVAKFIPANDEACLAAGQSYAVLLGRALKAIHFNVVRAGVLICAKDKNPDLLAYILPNITREFARPFLIHTRLYVYADVAKVRIGMAGRFDGPFLVGVCTERLYKTVGSDDIRICALIKQVCNQTL
jgi:hypothetical protein